MTTRPTPEQARAYAEALVAWSEGKKVEMCVHFASPPSEGEWQSFYPQATSGFDLEYRILPDPPKAREWWVNVYPNKFDAAYLSKAVAENMAGNNRLECIHVREILDTEIVVNKAEYEELRRNEAALREAINSFRKCGAFSSLLTAQLELHGAKL